MGLLPPGPRSKPSPVTPCSACVEPRRPVVRRGSRADRSGTHSYIQKYALWTGFNVAQAAVLSPLLFLQPALLARAGLYTVGVMGSIAFVGATAKQEKYLYLGGPLLAGVVVVALSGLAPLVLPATAVRTLMWTENLWLYGGLCVFSGEDPSAPDELMQDIVVRMLTAPGVRFYAVRRPENPLPREVGGKGVDAA